MKNKLVDLHIHSYASDGTYTPQEIIDKAMAKDISIIALTDHNTMKNSKEISLLAEQNGITAINGIELDTVLNDEKYHVLGLKVDYDNKELLDLGKNTKSEMMANNRLLIEKMCHDYPQLSLNEYDEYIYDRTRGGWESINYLFDKGISSSQIDGLHYYGKYIPADVWLEFPPMSAVINTIHAANGYAILAHPGEYFYDAEPTEQQLTTFLNNMRDAGIDGIECFYPSHSDFFTETCVKWCNENNLMITAGCDCHGAFLDNREIGKIKISADMLNIDKLL